MSAFTGMWRCLGLATRRYRWQALAWMVPLWLFLLVNPIALQRTYPSFEERTAILSQMGDAPGVRLLFGPAPATGSVGEFASWEDGGYLLWFVAIMAIMLTTAMARRDEQDGHVEVVLGAGAGRWAPFASATAWALGAMALTGAGLAASLIGVDAVAGETPLRGALVFGGVAIAQGWAFAGIALVASQLVRDVSAARGLCFTVFGVAFAVRVLADETGAAWLRWLSPLAWRDVAEPFGAERVWAFAVFALVVAALVVLAALLHSRRELLGALLADRSVSTRRWRVRGPLVLIARLGARRLAAWSFALMLTGALFGAMSGGLLDLIDTNPASAAYIEKIAPEMRPAVQYTTLLAVVIVALVATAVVQRVLDLAASEERGLPEAVLACGVPRTRVLMAAVADAIGAGVVLLLVSGAALAASTATQVSEDHAPARALVSTLTQLPGVVAAAGIAALLVGAAPRWRSLAWALIAWSSFARFFGGLIDMPKWAQDLGVLGHVVDPWGTTRWVPLAVQLVVGLACCGAGLAVYRRRDIPA
ncbi:beta-carotene 15,15'-monooxygenase [Schaalia meyeri]|uniref:ABC transporter permease n=1 Tax=Schaalia meyeri TaxID=52773 RepID=UPI0006813960|nr:beta-carotene 15,15'-monooxygenase [Schaalia meyeri]AKU64510.1 beta-carotene 15,15'-monooxygenase [Schaalia meyeri]OFQ22918.1 beta-carotene 15,15'-monooxygenase [Actinomyces sp. HMSC062G12]